MKRLLLLACLLVAAPVSAQTLAPSPQSLTTQFSSTCTSTSCATWLVPGTGQTFAAVTISITGTYTGTMTFEGSVDGIQYATISVTALADGSSTTTTTSTGQFAVANSGFQAIRVKATALSAGGPNLWAVRGGGVPKGLSPFLTRLYTGDGTCPLPAWSFASDTDLGVYRVGANNLAVCANSANLLDVNTTRVLTSIPLNVAEGTITADAPALSTTATWNNAGVTFANIRTNVTDTASNAASLLLDLQVAGASEFSIRKNGFIMATEDIQIPAGNAFKWDTRSKIASSVDGGVTLTNAAGTDFARLSFGGDTSSFPSWKRVTVGLVARLADDSANTTVTGTDFITASGSMVAGVASGYKIARGATAFDGSNPTTVATGLTTVVSCTATLRVTAAVTTTTAFVTHAAPSGANVDFYAWLIAGGASTLTETFDWICVGT